ncbi:MAG: endonuclease/exonuclease/phosphatase family protein [bacterium]
MKKNFCLLLTGIMFLTAGCHPHRRISLEQMDIKVMSFNIRYGTAEDGENHWNNRKTLVYEVIRHYSPDIIGLQEALRVQIDEIKNNIPGYEEIGQGREGGEEGEYSAILYRTKRFDVNGSETFWLSDTPEVPSKHWGNACIRICTWGHFTDRKSGSAFYLYNTHLDHQSQASREKSVRLIAERIHNRKHPDPFILTGDFNAGEHNPAVRYLTTDEKEQNIPPVLMKDTYRTLHPEAEEVGTFNGFKGITTGEKIDYIFAAPETRVLSADIIQMDKDGQYPSDHFPVTAEIRFEPVIKIPRTAEGRPCGGATFLSILTLSV